MVRRWLWWVLCIKTMVASARMLVQMDIESWGSLGVDMSRLRYACSLWAEAGAQYWSNCIASNCGNSKKLWCSLSSVLSRDRSGIQASPDLTANKLAKFFTEKVEGLHADTDNSPPLLYIRYDGPQLCNFREVVKSVELLSERRLFTQLAEDGCYDTCFEESRSRSWRTEELSTDLEWDIFVESDGTNCGWSDHRASWPHEPDACTSVCNSTVTRCTTVLRPWTTAVFIVHR